MATKKTWKAKQWKKLGKPRPSALVEEDDAKQSASECLGDWMKEMVKWGKLVNKDIKKIEKHCKVPKGAPGDPPDPPWNGK